MLCFSTIEKYFKDFMGTSSANPYETSLVHLGEPWDLKGLLHRLNAIRDSYESELGFSSFVWFCSKMRKVLM